MNHGTSSLKRFVALALALVLLVSNADLGIALHAFAADSIAKSSGQIVAENYAELTDAEKALLSSGSLAGPVVTYTVPSDSNLIQVDIEAKKITAKTESGWNAVKAVIVVNGADYETVTLTNGTGTYKYTGNSFSVKVTYEMKKEVAAATQEMLLSTPAWLKDGLAEMEAGYATDTNLGTVNLAMDTLVRLANGMSMALGSATVTAKFGEEGAAAVKALNSQIKNNGGSLDLQLANSAYKSSASKVQYLLQNGASYRTILVDTYEKLAAIHADGIMNNSILDSFLKDQDPSNYTKWNALKSILGKLVADLEVLAASSWTAAQKGTSLVSSNPDYAKLDTLVAALNTTSAMPTIKNPLVVDTAVIQANLAMCNVNVKVILNTVDPNPDSNALVEHGTYTATVTVAEDATEAEVKQAVKDAGVEDAAKASWGGAFVQGQFVSTASELPDVVSEDVDYVITYNPRKYSITYNYSTNAPTSVYYGYKMTLSVHADPERAYDYTVNGTAYAQGEVITITGNTEISRSAGKAYSGSNLYKVVSENYGNATTQAILQSGAVKGNQLINVRKPDPADAQNLLVLEKGKLTANNYDAAYEGLSWVPYTYGESGTENKFSGNEATWDGQSAKVKYILRLNNFSKDQVKSILDLAATLKKEAENQVTILDKLASYYTTMGQLDKTKLGALNGVIDVTDFTPDDGTEEDAKNIELRAYFKDVVSGIIKNNVDSNNKLKIYNMLGQYNSEGLRYFYKNSALVLNEIDVLSGYLSAMLADAEKEAALKIMVAAAGYPDYADKIADLEGVLAEVKANLKAPNAKIDLNSDKLGTLMEALTSNGKVENKTADVPYMISDTLTAQDSGLVMIQVIVSIRGDSETFVIKELERGIVVTQAMVDGLNDQIAQFVGDVTHYELEAEGGLLEDLVGKPLERNFNTYYSYGAREYVVTINNEYHESISINDLEINLPKHPELGFTYKYVIDGQSCMTSTYTFTMEQLSRLFKNGTYNITRSVINEADEKFNEAFGNKEGWEIVKDEDGNVTGLNANIAGNKDGIMGFIMDLVDSGYTHVELNGEALLYMENDVTEVSLQTLINAILKDNSFCSDTLIDLGEKGQGKLVSALLSLGNDASALTMRDLAFTLTMTSVPAQMGSVAEGLETIKPYFEYQSNNGLLNIKIDMPERAYEAYLMAMMASAAADKKDITAINSEIAMNFLWDYVTVIKESDATPTTLENTFAQLGVDVDLAGYEEHYEMIKRLLSAEGVETENGQDDAFDLKLTLKSKEAIDELFNFLGINTSDYETELGMVKEYKDSNAGLEIVIDAYLANAGTSYEALVIDFEQLKQSNKEEKAKGIDFTTKLTSRIGELKGGSAVMLLSEVKGNLTINNDTILDLNGQTLNGNITVKSGKLIIIDSALATADAGTVTGTVTGQNISIFGGKFPGDDVSGYLKDGYEIDKNSNVRNELYTISVADGELVINLTEAALEKLKDNRESYFTFAQTVSVDLAADLILDYYAVAGALAYVDPASNKSQSLYSVNHDDLMELVENTRVQTDLEYNLLDSVSVANMSGFANAVAAALLDFGAIAKAEAAGETFAACDLIAAPRMVKITHIMPEDYLTFGLTSDSSKSERTALKLKFSGSENMKNFAQAMDTILEDSSVVTVKIEELTVEEGSRMEVSGTAKLTLNVDLSKETEGNYAIVLAAVMGTATGDAAWAEAVNSDNLAEVMTMINAVTLTDFTAALEKYGSRDFASMAEKLGMKYDVATGKKGNALLSVVSSFGKLLTMLDFDQSTATVGSFLKNNVYTISKELSAEEAGRGAFNDLPLSAMIQIKQLCNHRWGEGVVVREASCEQTGLIEYKCDLCGNIKTEEVPKSHKVVSKPDRDPTCTQKGYEDYTECSVCGQQLSGREIPATGHTEVKVPAVAPTCTETGLTEGINCSVCNAVVKKQEVVPALGHDLEVYPGYAATCIEDGMTDGEICLVCDYKKEGTVIPATGVHVDEEEPWHACDECGTQCSTCVDEDNDGYCDLCGINVGKKHVDENKDHFCDECGERVSWCFDLNRDHDCDLCGKTFTKCIDFNRNHHCDICWVELSSCTDEDGDHRCDYCGRRMARCEDTNGDHLCDSCGKTLSECVDGDRDGFCDICGMSLSWVVRLAGDNRADTARDTAEELKALLGREKFDAIIYVNGYHFADALTGAYLANMLEAPILLYFSGESAMNLQYIQENLSANGTVYILGGVSVMPRFVERELQDAGINCKRYAGADRFETNIEILKGAGFNGGETVLVCASYEFADSLSASATGMPVLLVHNSYDELRDVQIDYLESLPKACNFIIIGGPNAVNEDLADALAEYDANGKVERVFGETRFETSIAVAEEFFPDPEQVVLAYAWMFPDALCGGTIGYATGSPIILTSDVKVDKAASYNKSNGVHYGYIVGGPVHLTDEVVCVAFDLDSAEQIHVR